jgi:hypothetical protein
MLQHSRPISMCEPSLPPITAPPTLTVGGHLSGLSPPNPPLLLARVSLPVSSPSLSHPRIDSLSAQCCHLCAHTLEPSRHHSCSMAPCPRCHLRPALLLTVPPGCRSQPLNDEALEQPTSLAELLVLKARRPDQGIASPSCTYAACAGKPVCAAWPPCPPPPCPAHPCQRRTDKCHSVTPR